MNVPILWYNVFHVSRVDYQMCTNDEMMDSDVTDTRGDLLLAPETEPEPEEMWWRDSAGDWWQETGTPTYPRTTLVLPTQLHNTPIHHTLLVTLSPLLPLVNIWLSVVGGWLDDMTLASNRILYLTHYHYLSRLKALLIIIDDSEILTLLIPQLSP